MDASGPERVPWVQEGLERTFGETREHRYLATPTYSPRSPLDEAKHEPDANHTAGSRNSNRIGGLRSRTFWLLILIVGIVIIGASIGGAVGGSRGSHESVTTSTATSPPAAYVYLSWEPVF